MQTMTFGSALRRLAINVVRKYKDRKSRKFLAGADMFVIAHAMAMGKDGVVVSHEGMRRQNALVKIPALCMDFEGRTDTYFSNA